MLDLEDGAIEVLLELQARARQPTSAALVVSQGQLPRLTLSTTQSLDPRLRPSEKPAFEHHPASSFSPWRPPTNFSLTASTQQQQQAQQQQGGTDCAGEQRYCCRPPSPSRSFPAYAPSTLGPGAHCKPGQGGSQTQAPTLSLYNTQQWKIPTPQQHPTLSRRGGQEQGSCEATAPLLEGPPLNPALPSVTVDHAFASSMRTQGGGTPGGPRSAPLAGATGGVPTSGGVLQLPKRRDGWQVAVHRSRAKERGGRGAEGVGGGRDGAPQGVAARRWPGVSVSHKRSWNSNQTTWRAVVLLDRKNHQVAVHGIRSQEEAGCARDLLFIWREIYFGRDPATAAHICIFPFETYAPYMRQVSACRTEAQIKERIKKLRDNGTLRTLASSGTPVEVPQAPWPAPFNRRPKQTSHQAQQTGQHAQHMAQHGQQPPHLCTPLQPAPADMPSQEWHLPLQLCPPLGGTPASSQLPPAWPAQEPLPLLSLPGQTSSTQHTNATIGWSPTPAAPDSSSQAGGGFLLSPKGLPLPPREFTFPTPDAPEGAARAAGTAFPGLPPSQGSRSLGGRQEGTWGSGSGRVCAEGDEHPRAGVAPLGWGFDASPVTAGHFPWETESARPPAGGEGRGSASVFPLVRCLLPFLREQALEGGAAEAGEGRLQGSHPEGVVQSPGGRPALVQGGCAEIGGASGVDQVDGTLADRLISPEARRKVGELENENNAREREEGGCVVAANASEAAEELPGTRQLLCLLGLLAPMVRSAVQLEEKMAVFHAQHAWRAQQARQLEGGLPGEGVEGGLLDELFGQGQKRGFGREGSRAQVDGESSISHHSRDAPLLPPQLLPLAAAPNGLLAPTEVGDASLVQGGLRQRSGGDSYAARLVQREQLLRGSPPGLQDPAAGSSGEGSARGVEEGGWVGEGSRLGGRRPAAGAAVVSGVDSYAQQAQQEEGGLSLRQPMPGREQQTPQQQQEQQAQQGQQGPPLLPPKQRPMSPHHHIQQQQGPSIKAATEQQMEAGSVQERTEQQQQQKEEQQQQQQAEEAEGTAAGLEWGRTASFLVAPLTDPPQRRQEGHTAAEYPLPPSGALQAGTTQGAGTAPVGVIKSGAALVHSTAPEGGTALGNGTAPGGSTSLEGGTTPEGLAALKGDTSVEGDVAGVGGRLAFLWQMLVESGVGEEEQGLFCWEWVCGTMEGRRELWYRGIEEAYRRGDVRMVQLWVRTVLGCAELTKR